MSAIIIGIEGLDATGKRTQSLALNDRLNELGYDTKVISFPQYEDDSSIFVKKYLSGEYSTDNRYAICTYYTMDRFITSQKDWFKEDMETKDFIIFDRFTASNMQYHTAFLDREEDKDDLVDFILKLEHDKLNIPKPDIVFYLDLDPNVANKLLRSRAKEENRGLDIHEVIDQNKFYAGKEYIIECYNTINIDCNDRSNESILSKDSITDKIFSQVLLYYLRNNKLNDNITHK